MSAGWMEWRGLNSRSEVVARGSLPTERTIVALDDIIGANPEIVRVEIRDPDGDIWPEDEWHLAMMSL